MTRAQQLKEVGKLGGQKVAQKYDDVFFQSRSSKGGQSCLRRYGRDFYRAIRMKREK